MKRTVLIFLFFAGICFCLAAAPRGRKQESGIYHKGWIDFNKNGVMDVYEDPDGRNRGES